jgi:hypothetical protein
MRRSGKGSGGGLGMNKVKHRSAPKAEPKPKAIRPSGAASIGLSYGSHITGKSDTSYRGPKFEGGKGYSTPVGPTDNVKAVGVGGGRTIHACGSQQGLSPVRPVSKGRDTLAEFGADSPIVRTRK